ncbi:transporter substrate-binding domain-containing protein [Vibrio sp.]|uniref:substrate-binding periplasmic protein n=1 Tax=Vibrio sp. TaxID=678 RepID=UPI00311F596C
MTRLLSNICTFVLLILPLEAWPASLKLAYSDIESYPFQLGNGTDVATPPGLALDILNHVGKTLNLNINYIRLPGKRVLEEVASGNVDGGFIFSYNTQRAQYARYPMNEDKPDSTKRIATIGYYFYVLEGQTVSWDGEHFAESDYKIGAHLGYSIVKDLQKKQLKVHEVKTTEQLFSMLQLRRLPVIAVQDTMAQQFLSVQGITNIEQVNPAIKTKDYFLVLSEQFLEANPQIAQQIWNQIAISRDSITKQAGPK